MRAPWNRGKRTRSTLSESEQAKRDSQATLGEVRARREEVDQVARHLRERRRINGFGDSIEQAYRERYQT